MNESHHLSQEEIEAAHEEANQFNKLVNGGKASAEYLSVITKEQTPEQTKEIIRSAEKHIRNINAFGELAHGTRGINYEIFSSINENGLKSLVDIKEETGREPSLFSLFPDMISCGMNGASQFAEAGAGMAYNDAVSYGVEGPKWWEKGSDDVQQKESDYIPELTLIINPRFVKESVEHMPEFPDKYPPYPLKFVGTMFFRIQDFEISGTNWEESVKNLEKTEEPFLRRLLEYCEKVGWVESAIKSGHAKNAGDFLLKSAQPNYDAFPGEVVISNKYKDLTKEKMVDGLVIHANYSSQIIGWLNSLSIKKPELAIPLYDIEGNLLWPVRMSNEQVKQFIVDRP